MCFSIQSSRWVKLQILFKINLNLIGRHRPEENLKIKKTRYVSLIFYLDTIQVTSWVQSCFIWKNNRMTQVLTIFTNFNTDSEDYFCQELVNITQYGYKWLRLLLVAIGRALNQCSTHFHEIFFNFTGPIEEVYVH